MTMDTADIIATIKRTLDDDDLTCSEMVARIRTALRDTAICECKELTGRLYEHQLFQRSREGT